MSLETGEEEIPKGGHQRMLLGVPTSITMGCIVFGCGPFLAWGAWVPLAALSPVWMFLRFQHKRDPHCLRAWWDHLTLARHYEA